MAEQDQAAGPPTMAPPGASSSPVASQGTEPMAVWSLVCGIAGFFFLVPAIPGVILGHMAINKIQRTGQEGRGLAVAGLVISYIALAMVVLTLLLAVLVFVLVSDVGAEIVL